MKHMISGWTVSSVLYPIILLSTPAMAEMLCKVQMQDALPAGCWPGVHGSRFICLLTDCFTDQDVNKALPAPKRVPVVTWESPCWGNHLGLAVNESFKVNGVSCCKGRPLPAHIQSFCHETASGYPLEEEESGRQSASDVADAFSTSTSTAHTACPTPWGRGDLLRGTLWRGWAAYLSLISTSSASHSERGLSFSAPTAQTSAAWGVGCFSSVCWSQGYSWPSHSSSESEEELSSELESSLDVVSYLQGGWAGAEVLAQYHSTVVGTCLHWHKWKKVLQKLCPPVFY